ncbi:hypothetical protein DAEQUDRAFT_726103 [Daedalea quercina L-15889]|uniref:Nudix hydrolase domain-containing protein n=1 Tax=Daedalea quercina L-15889 TaxID=1314783 RepID=A0A165QQM5_9APHY|nr:hypothetical protein DAEQUDRAFT_726103 [Daedalea quercina L-15889]
MTASETPSTPRKSASVIVVNSQNEVLLVQRNPKSQSFAGAHVFPGGNYDQKQDDSIGMTAIREVFEETGLLLAAKVMRRGGRPSDAEMDLAREEVHAQRQLFKDFLSQHNLELDLSLLWPFTQWVTPPTLARRFHTQFYLAFLEDAPSSGFKSGRKQERLPTPDGEQEVIAARFVHPQTALADARANKIALMPPQVYLLTTIADILAENENAEAQQERLRDLSQGVFGRMVVQPRALPHRDEQGRTIFVYEGDEARGGSKGRLHRSLARFERNGVATDVVLQRNFDVFTELEGVLSSASSKL